MSSVSKVHNTDAMEDKSISRELEPSELRIIRTLLRITDKIPILEKFRRSVEGKDKVPINREDSSNIRLSKFRKTPGKMSRLETFHMFPKLPRELRGMIWRYAAWAQDRFVETYRLRRIKSAPCPVLFLTCKEAKFWTTDLYKRVKNGDLIYGRIMPAFRIARGPVISFENDIMMIGDWHLWNSSSTPFPKEVAILQAEGKSLRPIHKRIKARSKRGFHRVAVQRPHHVHPELIFYKNARKHLTTFQMYGGHNNWGWTWANDIEEVWAIDEVHNYIDASFKAHVARVSPTVPGDDCSCSLCERADAATAKWIPIPYHKPSACDIEEHERIFETIGAFDNWVAIVAQGLDNLNL